MNDFLIYAARLQDAGVKGVWVSFGTAKDCTRTMTVSVLGNGGARPHRKFCLDGTDRVLERIKDDLLYEDKMNAESIEAACADFPALAEDLREWFADWTPPPTDQEVKDIIVSEDEVEATKERMLGYIKGLMRGLDSAKEKTAIKKDTK